MSNALASLLSFIIMLGVMVTVLATVTHVAQTAPETRIGAVLDDAIAATAGVTAVSAQSAVRNGNSFVDVTIQNDGRLSYAAFRDWDVNVQYTGAGGKYRVLWVPYSASLEANTWAVEGMYLDAGASTPEALGPGVLDPLEYARINIRLGKPPGAGSGWVVVTPPDGVPTTVFF